MRSAPGARLPLQRRFLWLAGLYLLLDVALIATGSPDSEHHTQYGDWLFLVALAAVASRSVVRLDRGTLNLTAIAGQTGVLLLEPAQSAAVGLIAGGTALVGRLREPAAITQLTGNVLWFVLPTSARLLLATTDAPVAVVTFAALSFAVLVNLVVTGLNIAFDNEESIAAVWRRSITVSFIVAYGYFAVTAVLLAHLLDGTNQGYLYAGSLVLLTFALTDTLTGRRVRAFLQSQLDDAERHLVFSRAVEGVVHNLRNSVASVVAHLAEVDAARLDEESQRSLATAVIAADDAAASLRRLTEGASPRVVVSPSPIDLNQLIAGSASLMSLRIKQRDQQLGVHQQGRPVPVRGDPLLLREVLTNLLLNASDATPDGGRVDISCGMRTADEVYVSVSDTGPGLSLEHRSRLFEPHFTTKIEGTGMGLFVSYGIVREHGGQLIYEGNGRGATFTVLLPIAGRENI